MAHDIIDNRNEKLLDRINLYLDSSEQARFAVGYFFLSGFEGIAAQLQRLKEVRLLIGNTTDHETIDQLAARHLRLDDAGKELEEQLYQKRTDQKRLAGEAAGKVSGSIALMDQTDANESLVKTLADLIAEKRLKVRVYTKGRMHAKAYIFGYGPVYDLFGNVLQRDEKGIAVVGSSNLSLSGLSHNTEMNVVVHGNDNYYELCRWFDELWNDAQDFDESLMYEMRESWAMAPVTPYDIYMKTLYTLVHDRIEGTDKPEILWDDEITRKLAEFQKVAVKQAVGIIRDYGGVFIADVVGLGKSYIGAAIVKHFERISRARPLIICPPPLVNMWERYDERYDLHARVLSMGYLQEGDGSNILWTEKYRDRDFVLVDESHNFRHKDTQRYKLLQEFLSAGDKKCCFLTATPRNKSALDVYNQMKLFHPEDKTDLPISPADLKEYFKLIEQGQRKLPDLLANVLIRRTRNHILRWYGKDAGTHKDLTEADFDDYLSGKKKAYVEVGGKHQFFPARRLETIEYSIESTYQGIYRQLRAYMGKERQNAANNFAPNELTYARYGLYNYVLPDKRKKEPYAGLQRAGFNLRGLIRILLFKRFESSVYAFRETVLRQQAIHEKFVAALDAGIVPAGEEAQMILYESDFDDQTDLLDALAEVSGKYRIEDFDVERLRAHIEQDIRLYKEMFALVQPITPQADDKLQTLKKWLAQSPLKDGKRLIFTEYADTARYLYDNLNPDGKREDIDVIFSGEKSKDRVVARFAPKANAEIREFYPGPELNTVIATDVLAEGLNMQDCDKIVNYDLHWNPVRLIQRFGRIDRIGTENEVVYGFNFLPELGIEQNLHLHEKLHNRIQEIHDTIGEDAKILDVSERLNEEVMYAIYEKKNGGQLSMWEDEADFLDLNEAEEIMRELRRDHPEEYARIAGLRDGIRSAKYSSQKGMFVFCQADRYLKMYLVGESGEIVSEDIPRVLGTIKCGPYTPSEPRPGGYNAAVMKVKHAFDADVQQRQNDKSFSVSHTSGQKYVLRELHIMYANEDDEARKEMINLLDQALRASPTEAVKKELNLLRRNGVNGEALYEHLKNLYLQHNMKDWVRHQNGESSKATPKIVCSEGLV
ncbi:MAG: phospholipase D-like domain-containing protein [Chloroflexi bacterium]|nr:phospholipase D-like domain-containing protein [Chloroflexota bacterium]